MSAQTYAHPSLLSIPSLTTRRTTCHSPPDANVAVCFPSKSVSSALSHRTDWRVCFRLANLVRQSQTQHIVVDVLDFRRVEIQPNDRRHCVLTDGHWRGVHCWLRRSVLTDGHWCSVHCRRGRSVLNDGSWCGAHRCAFRSINLLGGLGRQINQNLTPLIWGCLGELGTTELIPFATSITNGCRRKSVAHPNLALLSSNDISTDNRSTLTKASSQCTHHRQPINKCGACVPGWRTSLTKPIMVDDRLCRRWRLSELLSRRSLGRERQGTGAADT